MAMSRKHYREVAEIIKEEYDYSLALPMSEGMVIRATLVNVAGGLATMFKIDNTLFDRRQFMEACGIE